jgi:hypothetical protein
MIDEAHDLLDALAHFMTSRFVHNKGATVQREGDGPSYQIVDEEGVAALKQVRMMGDCLDFRRLICEDSVVYPGEPALRKLYRFYTPVGTEEEVVVRQYGELRRRLRRSALLTKFDTLWFRHDSKRCFLAPRMKGDPAPSCEAVERGCVCSSDEHKPLSGVHVMQSLYTNPALHDGIPEIMRIVDKACTLSSCEAFIEAVGSMLNKHADKVRGCDLETYSMEAFIHWNAPALAKSDRLLSDALSHYFGDKNWHFTKTSKEGQKRSAQLGFKSIVMDQMYGKDSKFSFME